MIGSRNLRAFCRPPMGVPVTFAGVSTYSDGDAVCGLFDRPGSVSLAEHGTAGIVGDSPELRLPFNAFEVMPGDGDILTVTDEGVATDYTVSAPDSEDDGGFFVYKLYAPGTDAEDGDEL